MQIVVSLHIIPPLLLLSLSILVSCLMVTAALMLGYCTLFQWAISQQPNELMHTRYTGRKQRSCFIINISKPPKQQLSAVLCMLVFSMACILQRKFSRSGSNALVALILYSVFDFIIRFFRADEPTILNIPLSLSQITALLQIVLGIIFLIFLFKTSNRKQFF